jgi:hypothetical protein
VLEVGAFPKGLRLTGAGGLNPTAREEARWWLLPRYVREAFPLGTAIGKAAGGGYIDKDSGEVVRSAWTFRKAQDGVLYFDRRQEP